MSILKKYAKLLIHYCLELQRGERLFIRTTMLAEPLLREVYREAIMLGAIVEYDAAFRERGRILFIEGTDHQLEYVSPAYKQAMEKFDAYLFIRAPYNLREEQNVDADKVKTRQNAHKDVMDTYFRRTADRSLKRNLCQYPTLASAQEAGMSLEEYEAFVFTACNLYDEDPAESWQQVRANQQRIVDHLNGCSFVEYKAEGVDISFSTKGRTWINSDGKTNMPSGEVFTAPVDDSVNGVIHFSFPAIYMGHEVEGVTLWVKDGYVEKWEAKKGEEFLSKMLDTPGARRFGEAAIGTNYNIQQITKNILFDEKIGGSIHMAIGQAYPQCGGINKSTVHWDMITDMKNGGAIFADGEKIYEDGSFIF